ncbi:MAG: TAXI family TRAP transporter solute-binding subunit [Planctomycetota bacterium]
MKSHPTTKPPSDKGSTPVKTLVKMPYPSRWRELFLLLAALAFVGCGVWIWGPWRVEPILRFRMAAGELTGARYQMASAFADHLRKHSIELELIPSAGSEESLDWLNDRKIDLALVQGGLSLRDRTEVRQLSALHVEPLHVLVRGEFEATLKDRGLAGLKGKRVFLGSRSSGTHVLAVNLLEFAGLGTDPLRDPNSVIVADELRNFSDLLQASPEALPDAIFHVSIVPSPTADELIGQKGYRLVSIPFSRAFTRSRSLPIDSAGRQSDDRATVLDLDRSSVEECTIPAYTYGVFPDVPNRDLVTVGSRMLLVTHRKESNPSVQRLLSALFDPNLARQLGLDGDAKLLELPSEYELHPGVGQYRNRNKVLIASDMIDYTENLLAIAATVIGALFFLYQWYAEHERGQRECRFGEFMTRVIAIEQSALSTEVASKLDLANLIRLQRELANLKAEAVRGFAAGEWHGTHMLNGLLALINDTREQITRLILHERENIEKSAESQQVDLDALWQAEAKGWEDK